MKAREILGLVLGGIGILVLDLGFSGASMTDLLYISPPGGPISGVPSNIGSSIVGSLMPGGNTTLFFIGFGFLVVGMVILILHNRNLGKPSISAMPSK
jgi:hypothetical protein